MAEDRISKLTPRQRYDLEAQSSFAQADALLNTPVFVNHGDADMMVPVANSRYAVRMLQRWGYDVRYREHPGKGHASLGNEDEVMEWLLQHKRTLYPQKVRVRAAELSSAAAFWVRVNQRSDERDFMLAEAKLTAPNTIQLDTKNVVSVTLSPGSPLVVSAKPLKIVWNGAERTATLKDGKVTLLAEGYSPAKLEKTPETAGPMAGAMNGPFAVVVGTIAEDEMARKLCESKAKDLAGYWMQTQHQPVRMFKDTEISEADLARYSLVLIGGSEANAVTRKLAGSLPLKISGSDVTIDGRTFHAPDAGVAMVYPHPLNSARYVLLMASTSPSGMYFINPLRFDMNDHDFVIADGVMPDFRRVRTAAQSRIASGWFDTQWRLKPELVEEGDPAIRNGALVVKLRPDLTHYVDGGKQLKTEILDFYVGGYESREAKLKLVREGNTLIVHIPNQPAFSMVATSETEFVLPEANAAVTFVKDAQGKVTHARVEGSGFAFDSKKVN
jgi:acetyl esterase/lipase